MEPFQVGCDVFLHWCFASFGWFHFWHLCGSGLLHRGWQVLGHLDHRSHFSPICSQIPGVHHLEVPKLSTAARPGKTTTAKGRLMVPASFPPYQVKLLIIFKNYSIWLFLYQWFSCEHICGLVNLLCISQLVYY